MYAKMRTLSREFGFERVSSYNLIDMKKNAPLAFRIPAELKKKLEHIADREARSVSQICEILLSIGTESYNREGTKYLQAYIGGKNQ